MEYHIVFKCERLTKKKLKYLKMARLSFTLKNPCVSIKRKANVEKIYDLRHIEVHICGQQQHKVKAAEFEGQKRELVTLESFLLRKSSHLGMSFQSDQEAFLGWKFGSPVV